MRVNVMAAWLAVFFGSALLAQAEFVKPTDVQIAAAAADPAGVGPLVKGASVQEAARVIRDVFVQVVKIEKDPAKRDARIRAVILAAFRAFPGKAVALAAALGEALAASPAASRERAAISAIQLALIDVGGRDSRASGVLASAFGNSYTMAMQTVGTEPGSGMTVMSIPPPPPVAIPYDAQVFL